MIAARPNKSSATPPAPVPLRRSVERHNLAPNIQKQQMRAALVREPLRAWSVRDACRASPSPHESGTGRMSASH